VYARRHAVWFDKYPLSFLQDRKGGEEKKAGDMIYSLDTLSAWRSLVTKMGFFGVAV